MIKKQNQSKKICLFLIATLLTLCSCTGNGEREFEKAIANIEGKEINKDIAFKLYDT